MGERREVARGAEAAARRHHRMDGPVEHADEKLDRLDAYAGEADRQSVGAKQEHPPHDLVGERVADARGVRPDEVPLQRGRVGRLDAHVGEVAETGGDTVDGGPLLDQAVDHGAGRAHPLSRRRIERDLSPAPRDLDDVVDGEVGAGDRKGRHRSLYYAPCDGCRTP